MEGTERAEMWQGARTVADGLRVPKAIGDFLVLLFLVFFGTALACEISNQLTTESHGT